MQDNDPTHKVAAEVIKDWNDKRASSVALMPNWPPNSPDLNPIENLWSIIEAKVDALGCENFMDFKHAVDTELRNTSKKTLRSFIASMPKRMRDVIAAEGDKIKY